MVMKKTVILLILTLMMVVSGMCYAAGDGSDLNSSRRWPISLWQYSAAMLRL